MVFVEKTEIMGGGIMKKLMTIVILGGLSCLWLLPTASSAAGIRGGLKAGLNLSNIHGADVSEAEGLLGAPAKYKVGFVGGGFITFNLSTSIAIQAEALYSMKGAKASEPGWNISANINYLEIPILVKFMIPTQGSVKPSLFVGPALALKMSARYKYEEEGYSEEGDIEEMKSSDLGLVFGAGLDIGRNIRTDLRYTLGISKVMEAGGYTFDVKNGAFSLMIGYCF